MKAKKKTRFPAHSGCSDVMKLPRPTDSLAGCVWLPRILAKARMLQRGELPPDYEARFCHPTGVDGQFMAYFFLSREDVMRAAEMDDEAVSIWFASLPEATPPRLKTWNETAPSFGRAGYPMAERFQVAMATSYKHLSSRGLTSVFEVLEADESES